MGHADEDAFIQSITGEEHSCDMGVEYMKKITEENKQLKEHVEYLENEIKSKTLIPEKYLGNQHGN